MRLCERKFLKTPTFYSLFFISAFTFGQKETDFLKEYQVKVNALTLPIGILNAGLETPISNHFTLNGDILISPWKSFKGNHLQIYMGNLEARYYLKEKMNGLYIGPNLGLAFFDLQKWNYWNTNKYQRGLAVMFGATLGYQYKINDRLSLDGFITGGNQQGNYKGYLKDPSIRYDSAEGFNKSGEWLVYKLGISLTYKFRTKKNL